MGIAQSSVDLRYGILENIGLQYRILENVVLTAFHLNFAGNRR